MARVRFTWHHAVAVAGIVACGDSTASDDGTVPLPERQLDASIADADAAVDGAAPPPPPSADSGAGDAKPDGPTYAGCNGALDCERVVFATTKEYAGTFGGVVEADARCQSHANTSQSPRVKGRKFLAWISVGNVSVASRFPKGTKPYVRPDGAKIASDWTDLTDADLAAGISLDEDGAPPGGSGRVWTGTANDGAAAAANCGGWKDGTLKGLRGNLGGGGPGWSAASNDACTSAGHLYCFEY